MSFLIRRTPPAFATHMRAVHRPSLSATQYNILGRRSLHLGAVGEAMGSIVTSTAEGLSSLHSYGLPWYLCIPLTAVCVNFTLRLPLQFYARRLLLGRIKLNPLVTAWASRHNAASPPVASPPAKAIRQVRVAGKIEKSRSRIYKAWGLQRWKSWTPLMGIFPFMLVSESLRRLSGAPVGALSQAMGFGKASSSVTDPAKPSDLFDASLSQGGGLWFTDLTAVDPYFALPVLCSAILARNSWFRMPRERLRALLSLDDPNIPQPRIVKLQKAFGRVLLGIPFFPLLFADLPSAIFLYWATTFSLTQLNEVILEKWLPISSKTTVQDKSTMRHALPFLMETSTQAPNKK